MSGPGTPGYDWKLSGDDLKALFGGIDEAIEKATGGDPDKLTEVEHILGFAVQRWIPGEKFTDQVKKD